MKFTRIVIDLWRRFAAFAARIKTIVAKYKTVLVNAWCFLLVVSLLYNLMNGGWASALGFFGLISKNISHCFSLKLYSSPFVMATLCLVSNILWFHWILALATWLGKVHPVFTWSWLGNNVNLLPLQKRYIGLVFIVLLILNLPSITCWEEGIFRVGTANWKQGVANSILFGLAHCAIGIPLGAGIALIALGLWLTWCYFIQGPIFVGSNSLLFFDGQIFATMNHTTFNMVGCVIMLIFVVKMHIELARHKVTK